MDLVNRLIIAIAAVAFAQNSVIAESTLPDADDWFRSNYAELWKENAWDKLEEILVLFDQTVFYHPPAGIVEAQDSHRWMKEIMREWKADGYKSSEMTGYRFEQLNFSTATFRTRWIDRKFDGSEVINCWWYMADAKNDTWVFTQLAEIDCEANWAENWGQKSRN